MNRPGLICFQTRRFSPSRRSGFTLIELLVAVTLTLIMMAAVVQIFAVVGESINNSRSTLAMSERIRAVASRLKLDLEGVTADMTPPGRPEEGKGYFEYIEGPIGPVAGLDAGYNTDEAAGTIDSTVGDRDDILQFTTRSRGEPFVGRVFVISTPGDIHGSDGGIIGDYQNDTRSARSQVAEVAWFLRGTTLYRRVLLVSPSFDADIRVLTSSSPGSTDPHEAEVPFKIIYRGLYGNDFRRMMGYYNNYDLSVHWDPDSPRVDGGVGRIVCNTLADLTRRECRFAHPPLNLDGTDAFPYALHNDVGWRQLGLPTLQECSHAHWPFPINGLMPYANTMTGASPVILTPNGDFDAWVYPYPFDEIDKDTGSITVVSSPSPNSSPYLPKDDPQTYIGPRVGEDVILTNVLSFDVKAWDPGASILLVGGESLMPGDNAYSSPPAGWITASRGAYVDLGYASTNPSLSSFSGMPDTNSGLSSLRVWDTWSIHYEHDGIDQGGAAGSDEGTNGFDDNNDGVVDDPDEQEAPPPYNVPLRGIQIKIRVFDPDSQQIREVTVQHDFMNQ